MPSPIAHLAMGTALWSLWDSRRAGLSKPVTRLGRVTGFVAFLGASMLPDLDVIPGVLTGDLYGFHNQEMHSLFAGLMVALLAGLLFGRLRHRRFAGDIFAVTFVSYSLHLLMDLLTYGRGVRLFWPLYAERIPAPVEVFGGLRWSEGIWYAGHWVTVGEESVFALLLLLCVWAYRQRAKGGPSG